MITRLEVDGFKSLRGFAIDLAPFTALVGPNSAGKSNILEALALVAHLAAEPIEAAFKHGRGRAIDQFTLEKGEPVREIRLAVELLLPVGTPFGEGVTDRLRYELTIARERRASGADRLRIEHERLTTLGREIGWAPSRTTETSTALAAARNGAPSEPSTLAVASCLSEIGLLQLDTARLRDESERIGGAALAPDASNLPTVLAASSPRLLGEIRADLVSLVPGISTFDVVAEKDTFRIELELSGGDRLPARLVSDGTLRALALLTAIRAEPTPSIIAIEEPENGIYPGRLRALLDLLRDASGMAGTASRETATRQLEKEEGEAPEEPVSVGSPPQVIITSHSPVVLAAMRDAVDGLRFIDTVRRDGHLITRARRIGPCSPGDRGQHTIPLREVDALLSLATSEAAE